MASANESPIVIRKPIPPMPRSYQRSQRLRRNLRRHAKKNPSLTPIARGTLFVVDLETKLAVLRALVWVPPLLFLPLQDCEKKVNTFSN